MIRQYIVARFVKGGPSVAEKAGTPAEAKKPVDAPPSASPAVPVSAATSRPTSRPSTTTKAAASSPPSAAPATDAPAPPSSSPTAVAAPATAEPTCGKKPLPDCPMQGWMKANAAGVAAGDDAAALGAVLDRIARMAPPGYAGWAQISTEGAAAARSGDTKGGRAACSGCHNQFRARYKAEMRAAPVR